MAEKTTVLTGKSSFAEEIRGLIRRALDRTFVPSSVYRVQFNKDFTFLQAASHADYLRALGIGAIYSSPCLAAVPGSNHGYNIIDPSRLNPEIGTPADHDHLCQILAARGLGVVLDIVPNHMAISSLNRWWLDVLENGPGSIYAHVFDINWEPVKKELKDKVLLPVLGDYYGRVLENQEVRLNFSAEGEFFFTYYEHRLPVAPHTYPRILEYGVDALKQRSGESPAILEYLSIITAFRNLPPPTERDEAKIAERHREKEIAKKRLSALAGDSPAVRSFIDSRLSLFNGSKGEPRSFDPLDRLLNEQAYRLAFWRVAADEINYRRFFDINDLAAIRAEDERVFQLSHALVFRWLEEGKISGLRVDHPDGLYDPTAYFKRLQRQYLLLRVRNELRARGGDWAKALENEGFLKELVDHVLDEPEFAAAAPLYIVAEKILDRKEYLPEDWHVSGTVGYDFLNQLNGLFVDASREKEFAAQYENFIGHPIDFEDVIYSKKKFFSLIHMASEINNLGHLLDQISERNRAFRDFTLNNLTLAIRETIACFPVYRTYISPRDSEVSERDQKYIHIAIEKARARTPALISAVYDFLRDVLLLKLESGVPEGERGIYRDFVLRFQQLTGPVMAKGLEDTSFYIYNRLMSLNEVGGYPLQFGCAPERFHSRNQERAKTWPSGFVTLDTHDTKRSHDVRMRLNALTEIPDEWKSQIARWAILNEKHKTLIRDFLEPRHNTEYLIYQSLLGIWPDVPPGRKEFEELRERLVQYALKAVREAKLYTNWVNPDAEYEEAVKKFILGALESIESSPFLEAFIPFQEKVADIGKFNSLSSLVLALGSPGVFDLYQGSELWNYRLVDPDNRAPVDYAARKKTAEALNASGDGCPLSPDPGGLLRSRKDGRIKFYLLSRGLLFRGRQPALFAGGEYHPLEVTGERAGNIVAFLRRNGDTTAVVAATRFFTKLLSSSGGWPGGEEAENVWKDTAVLLPGTGRLPDVFEDIFTGSEVRARRRDGGIEIPAAALFRSLPASLLSSGRPGLA